MVGHRPDKAINTASLLQPPTKAKDDIIPDFCCDLKDHLPLLSSLELVCWCYSMEGLYKLCDCVDTT